MKLCVAAAAAAAVARWLVIAQRQAQSCARAVNVTRVECWLCWKQMHTKYFVVPVSPFRKKDGICVYVFGFHSFFSEGRGGQDKKISDKPGLQTPESLDVQSEIIKLSIENSWLLAKL